jgi:hypothetical protein
MSDPPSNGILGLPVSVWIALLVGVAGIYALNQKPFQDTRPPITVVPLHHRPPGDGQVIEARLWQDPLGAVALARNSGAKPVPYPALKLKESIASYAKGNAKTLLMAVMVTGEPYTDNIETRRRTRYAVLAGLYRSGFIPVNADHIGFLERDTSDEGGQACGNTDGKTTAAADTASGNHDLVAFEWFGRDSVAPARAAGSATAADLTPSDRVLVLWLDQEGFRDRPILGLSRFLGCIAGSEHNLADLAVMGPANSDGLREMYDEVERARGAEPPWKASELRQMDIYSSRATASDQSVTNVAPDAKANLAKVLFDLTDGRIRLYRSVANDQEVEVAVMRELKHRGIDRLGQIALVAERDTLYARGMGSYFNGCRNPPRSDPSHPVADEKDHVACFTYLRGLDGIASAADTATDASAGSHASPIGGSQDSSASGSATPGVSDEATGPGQLDYLRRLSGTIASLRESGTRVRAIGVISSDVYDKLLVLQALRDSLPGALYFTFDLDARMLDRKSLRSTRQLLVGSSLGLTLRPELQGDIPPFRDSYQTSMFYATLLAVHRFVDFGPAHAAQAGHTEPQGHAGADSGVSHFFNVDSSAQAGLQWTNRPRVFAIGRSQEFDLTPPSVERSCDFDGRCPSVSIDRESWLWSSQSVWAKGLLVGVLLAALGLAGAALALGLRGIVGRSRTHALPAIGELRWNNERNSVWAAIAVIVVTALIWPYCVDRLTKTGIPTPLFGGANPWLSSLVDALSIVIVVLLVVRGQRKLNDSAEAVGREFGLKRSRKRLIGWHRQRRREVEEARLKNLREGAAPKAAGDARAEGLWELPKWLIWFWFPLRALSRRSGIDLAKNTDVSPLEAIIAQYLHHGTAAARLRRALPVTLAVVLLLVVPLEEIPGVTHMGRSLDRLSFLSLIAMQFLIFWTADALLLSRSFILALKRDQPAWPTGTDMLGLPAEQATAWLDLRLVGARTRGVSALVWYPSFVIGVTAVAALTIQFREFQFANNPIALLVGTLFVIGAAVALRTAAEALRREVKVRFENARLTADTAGDKRLELLLNRVDGLRDGAFAPYSEQPIVRAVLVPAATYGATVGLQYLHLGT